MAIDHNQIAADYVRHRRVHPGVLGCLMNGLRPSSRILEVGCGTGNYIIAIRKRSGCSCWGIDPSTAMLAQATVQEGQVRLVCGKAETLSFPDGHFDLVFSVDVVHHIGDRGRFFREAGRVLRRGGRVCTVTDSEWIIRHRQPLATYFPETIAVDLARYPGTHDVKTNMRDAGFVEREERTVEFAHDLSDLGPFRAQAYSCLRLIPEDAFRRGMARMEKDALAGPIPCVSRYSLLWGAKPSSG